MTINSQQNARNTEQWMRIYCAALQSLIAKSDLYKTNRDDVIHEAMVYADESCSAMLLWKKEV